MFSKDEDNLFATQFYKSLCVNFIDLLFHIVNTLSLKQAYFEFDSMFQRKIAARIYLLARRGLNERHPLPLPLADLCGFKAALDEVVTPPKFGRTIRSIC